MNYTCLSEQVSAHIPYFIRKPNKELDSKNLNLVLFLMMITNEHL
jgi:hypothetical protein